MRAVGYVLIGLEISRKAGREKEGEQDGSDGYNFHGTG
jgi:hypothetical protein